MKKQIKTSLSSYLTYDESKSQRLFAKANKSQRSSIFGEMKEQLFKYSLCGELPAIRIFEINQNQSVTDYSRSWQALHHAAEKVIIEKGCQNFIGLTWYNQLPFEFEFRMSESIKTVIFEFGPDNDMINFSKKIEDTNLVYATNPDDPIVTYYNPAKAVIVETLESFLFRPETNRSKAIKFGNKILPKIRENSEIGVSVNSKPIKLMVCAAGLGIKVIEGAFDKS